MKNLKIVRKSSKKTQLQVAKDLNIPVTTYATYEQNKATPPTKKLIEIANYFNCSIDYLIGHRTNSLIYVNEVTKTQSAFIKRVLTLDDSTINKLEGALIRIEEESANPWTIRR